MLKKLGAVPSLLRASYCLAAYLSTETLLLHLPDHSEYLYDVFFSLFYVSEFDNDATAQLARGFVSH
jgi:hypothetical protein